jgi:hypothetical protein
MKKISKSKTATIVGAALALLLLFTVPVAPASAAAGITYWDAAELASLIAGLNYDPDKEGSELVSRADWAEFTVKTSTFKGMAQTGARLSPYSDVPFTHAQAAYISVAARQGLLVAGATGLFRPEAPVKYEEALTSALKLLGFASEDFVGGYPYGQYALAKDNGLTDGVKAVLGESLTNQDAAYILYNLLCASPQGSTTTYAETLGYPADGGVISLRDIRSDKMTGPVTLTDLEMLDTLGLGTKPTIYIDNKIAERIELEPFFIIYYDTESNVLAAYSERVKGLVTGLSPNADTPTSVSIDDESYELATYAARQAFGLGKLGDEDLVVLLLGRDGKVADAYAELEY